MACREAVTKKIKGLCRKPLSLDKRSESNNDGEYSPALHLPPFWWGGRHEPKWPWQCWSMEDFSMKNCKCIECYQPCSCRHIEEPTTLKCKFPGHCGFHFLAQEKGQNLLESHKQNENRNLCCYCKLEIPEASKRYGDTTLPDPRCVGQYHSSLLENILGRGTALVIGKDKCSPNKKERSMRGYIPGDVHGLKGWSGCVGGDPMREELNNSLYPVENYSTSSKLSKMIEDRLDQRPCYQHPCQDHRYQYGIQPKQLCNMINS
ncbi:uncharacterized protein LOC124158502 [Ischnura elegans]|uniref:uncharacterized protein LOC124158502 n=1 Tax=Ischnura elegans TaxID=197161 RepID=UPI001ED87485|nr:uncharacterized protein LOC124158502 [Ischnura elegans]